MKDNVENIPPKTHDLEFLYGQTDLKLDLEQLNLLKIINSWNIEGSYQDYKDKLHQSITRQYAKDKIRQVDKLRVWLRSKLP